MSVEVQSPLKPTVAAGARPAAPAVEGKPVKAWAAFGAAWLTLYLYILIRWVTGPNFKRVPAGPTPLPSWMKTVITVYTPFGLAAVVFCVYWFIIRSYRRKGRFNSEALLLMVMGGILWVQDPWVSYYQPVFTFNSYQWNMGSWVADVPGWSSIAAGHPGAMQAYPVLFLIPLYTYALFTVTLLCAHLMRKAKTRWPQMSNLTLLGSCWLFASVFALVMEGAWLRLGFYGYWEGIPSLTLFHGHYYQIPVYESALLGLWWTFFAALMYYRNDRGETLAERGISQIRAGEPAKVALRLLALIGVASSIYMVAYNIPYQWFNLRTGKWPSDVQKRSYFTNGICGPGTSQACPSPNLPISRRSGVHFDPQGRVVVPRGTPPPGSETLDRVSTGP
jgi:Spirocyclase AveC-like